MTYNNTFKRFSSKLSFFSRKSKASLAILGLISIATLSGCGDDDGDAADNGLTVADLPTITPVSNAITNVTSGETVEISFTVSTPSGYASNSVTPNGGTATVSSTLAAGETTGTSVVSFVAGDTPGAGFVTFTATDNEGVSVESTAVINIDMVAPPAAPTFVGAVYAMTNGEGQEAGSFVQGPNTIVAYGRTADGNLTPISPFRTGGRGGDFDGGEGLDPLISAYALTKTENNNFLLAANAGTNNITSFAINDDFSLSVRSIESTGAIGPNSIATFDMEANADINSLVYVSDITRAEFLELGEPEHQGTLTGYWLLADGTLQPIEGSTIDLNQRPSAVQFSPDGNWLVTTSINAGAVALGSGSQDEVVVYRVNADGTLNATPTGTATSTLRGNTEDRNLPSAIGFQIVGDNYVVVTEAREFRADGTPPVFPGLQSGSVSTWQIQSDGSLTAISLDVASGDRAMESGRTACWLDFTNDGNTFFVSNAIEAGIASYSFDSGTGEVALLNETAALGNGTGGAPDGPTAFANTEGWIDLWITDDGNFLYQLFGLDGTIGIYRINGTTLEKVGQESNNLPDTNTQGIVAI